MAQNIQDTISFGYGTGLNWDDHISVMPKGDGKIRTNISITSDQAGNTASKILGNIVSKTIIDPTANSVAWDITYQTSPTRTRYTEHIANYFLYPDGTYDTAGVVINILTNNKNYKIYHRNELYTTLTDACDSIKTTVENLGDEYIYSVGYTLNTGYVSFYIDILDTSSSRGVTGFPFLYGEHGSMNWFFNLESKEIVGAYFNDKDNELYTFWGSDVGGAPVYSDNLIVKYSYNLGLSEILNSSSLSIPASLATWSKKYPITATVIGDDDRKLLFWTDGVNPPMSMNVERAINTAYGYFGDTYSDHNTDALRRIALNVIKIQPTYGALTDNSTVSEATLNTDITSHPIQFIYRYVFVDNEISTWSPVSYVTSHSHERADGSYDYSIDFSSYRCFIDPPESNTISKIQFAFKSTTIDAWRLCKTIDYNGSSDPIFVFSGAELTEVLDDSQTNILFDNVPIKSGAISSISDNRLLLADNTVGYSNTELDVTLSAVSSGYATSDEFNAKWRAANTVNSTTKDVYVNNSSSLGLGAIGSVYVVFKTTLREYIIQLDNQRMTDAQTADYFVSYINTKIVGSDPYISLATNSSNNVRITHASGAWLYGASTVFGHNDRVMKLKNGVSYNLGMVYYDQFGRRGYVNEIDKLYIPFYTEQSTFTDNEYFDVIQFEINHRPPSWAHSWGIYFCDNHPKYIQVPIRVADFTREDGNLRIKLSKILDDCVAFNPNFRMSYQFTKGDRLRWIGTVDDVTFDSQKRKVVTLLPDYIDVGIFGYSGDYNEYLSLPDYNAFPDSESDINAAEYVLVEIYTPNKFDTKTFYFETNYKFPVLNPGTASSYHGVIFEPVYGQGELQEDKYGVTLRNQSEYLSAICYFDLMDFRTMQHWRFESGEPVACYIDSQSASNYMESLIRNYGRPHITNPSAEQNRLNTIQWSNTFIPNSSVNGLSTFGFTDEKSMDDRYGRICSMVITGDVLNIIQSSKISSIYLGAQLSKDASGANILAYTNEILGESRALSEPYGSNYKYSIVSNKNYIYGFDFQSAIPWRKSYNGIEDLSMYKMKGYFKQKVNTLLQSGIENIIILSGFDAYNETYYLTFIDLLDSGSSETLAFHEPTNRWVSFYSFIPDMYASIRNMQFLTFKDGFMYDHSSNNAAVCTFYETQYGSEIWAVGNIHPSNNKTFNTIIEDSNIVWDMPDEDSITIDEDSLSQTNSDYTVHNGLMNSRLKSGLFKPRMGKFYAAFLRDGLKNGSFNQHALLNGRKLRGKIIICKLKNSADVVGVLRSVVIGSSI